MTVPLATSVLVVEDHDDTRSAVENLLTHAGFDVRTASHGAEALRMIDRHGMPHVIVLDLMLPWVNGVEVLATLREHANGRRVPVLVTTATATTEFDLRAYKPLKLIRKPLNYSALVATIQALLLETQFIP
ncbi:MAG TPA: response regulator [Vicinamibacterales bacterium]|nr:response regulator [Vicinamibacterales bacterium]